MKRTYLIVVAIGLFAGSVWSTRRGIVFGRGLRAISRKESPLEYWALLALGYAGSSAIFVWSVFFW